MKSSLIALVSLLIASGCAANTAPVVAEAPVSSSVSPYAHLESQGLWRDCDGHCGAPLSCIEKADAAYYASGGSDAAYEDAVAGCDDGTAGAR